ncbi:MAG: hypothetical protein AAGI51_01605 [Pseudomonadota bacterium]
MSDVVTSRLDEAEIGALRAELNACVDRMNSNENFCVGLVTAVVGFLAATPTAGLGVPLSIAATFGVLVGVRRYCEIRAHVHHIDSYLIDVEQRLSPDGGWTCSYYERIKGRPSGGFSDTRWAFWFVLTISALMTFLLPSALEAATVAPHAI